MRTPNTEIYFLSGSHEVLIEIVDSPLTARIVAVCASRCWLRRLLQSFELRSDLSRAQLGPELEERQAKLTSVSVYPVVSTP
jgi:hypothetical protein